MNVLYEKHHKKAGRPKRNNLGKSVPKEHFSISFFRKKKFPIEKISGNCSSISQKTTTSYCLSSHERDGIDDCYSHRASITNSYETKFD